MKRIVHWVNVLLHTSQRCLDTWLWLRWSHGIQWLVRGRDFELGCMGCLGSHLFYLHAFNILKLSDLATAPFVRPGWAVYSLVVSLICKASGWIECEHQKKKMHQSCSFSLAFCEFQDLLPLGTHPQTESTISIHHLQPSWRDCERKIRKPKSSSNCPFALYCTLHAKTACSIDVNAYL